MKWRPGSRVNAQVRMIDLMPTLLQLAGLSGRSQSSGATSLVPLFGAKGARVADRPAVSTSWADRAIAIRDRGWKYIRYYPGGRSSRSEAREELFNLDSDPGETRNAGQKFPSVLGRMRFMVDDYLLRNRRGATLLLKVEDPQERYEVRLTFDRRIGKARFGFPESRHLNLSSGSGWEFSLGRFDAGTLVLPLQKLPKGTVTRVSITSGRDETTVFEKEIPEADASARYQAGSVFEIEERAGFHVELYRSRAPTREEPTEEQSPEDARRLERLRALGYIDG